jgi:hypothetical protein
MWMRSLRRLLLSVALAAAIGSAACGTPPDKELQEAQAAIDAARAAGADQFARDEFMAAGDALKRAHDAVADRDYRLALNHALDAREHAQTAAKETATRKTAVRTGAERALADATAALAAAQAAFKTAQNDRLPPKTLAGPRAAIDDADRAVQEARTMIAGGNYQAAADGATRAAATLRQISRNLEQATGAGTHRRRAGPRKN